MSGGSYKPQPKPSEQAERDVVLGVGVSFEAPAPRRVFCKDCRHYRETHFMGFPVASCVATKKVDPVRGEVTDYVDCRKRNKGLDCALFEPKQAQPRLVDPTAAPATRKRSDLWVEWCMWTMGFIGALSLLSVVGLMAWAWLR